MLQQTQVATVIDYFNRFVERWPTVHELAAADERQVLAAWQGLGYYRRARNLHKAARTIVNNHAGHVPDTVEALLQLPGVGRYTAGAIASIAFDRPAPILDGNVKRVFARLFAIDQPIDDRVVEKRLWTLAASVVVRARHPGDVNQAIMELGATVCTPKGPRCLTCGVRKHCLAAERGLAGQLPVVGKRAKQTDVTHHVIAIQRDGKYLFERRPDTGLWAGMWQLRTFDGESNAAGERGAPPPQPSPGGGGSKTPLPSGGVGGRPASAARRFDCLTTQPVELGRFVHVTTHRRITFVVHHARANGRRCEGTWRSLNDIADLPLSNAQKKAIELVRARVD